MKGVQGYLASTVSELEVEDEDNPDQIFQLDRTRGKRITKSAVVRKTSHVSR